MSASPPETAVEPVEPVEPVRPSTGFPWGRLLVSLPFAVAAIWLVFRGVSAEDLGEAFASARPRAYGSALVAMAVLIVLRLYRWVVLVQTLAPVPTGQLLRIGAVGFMAIDLLPVRLGELARPLLLQKRAGVPFGAGTATVVVERMMDIAALLAVMAAVLAFAEIPPLHIPGVERPVEVGVDGRNALLVVLSVLLVPVVALAAAGRRGVELARWLLRPLPEALSGRLMGLMESFVEALRAIGKPGPILLAAALSLGSWSINVYVSQQLLHTFGLTQFGLPEAAVVMLVVAVALLFPSPAGGLGVFEAGATVALLLYAVPRAETAAFALALHATHVGAISLVGFVCLLWEGIGWRDLWPGGGSTEA